MLRFLPLARVPMLAARAVHVTASAAAKKGTSKDPVDDKLYHERHYRKAWALATKAIHAGSAPDETTGATIPFVWRNSSSLVACVRCG